MILLRVSVLSRSLTFCLPPPFSPRPVPLPHKLPAGARPHDVGVILVEVPGCPSVGSVRRSSAMFHRTSVISPDWRLLVPRLLGWPMGWKFPVPPSCWTDLGGTNLAVRSLPSLSTSALSPSSVRLLANDGVILEKC